MRSWDARSDTAVVDEPLYGHYLSWLPEDKRREHPGVDEIIRAMDCDWRSVTSTLLGPVPDRKPIWYQKHMAHHLTPDMDLDWVNGLTNCFLIRDPAAMIASFAKVIPNPTPEDLGLPQQVALFEKIVQETRHVPAVIQSKDVLENPESMLSTLCEYIEVPFDTSMMRWEPGSRDTDGVWAKHWYDNVNRSSSFIQSQSSDPAVPQHLEPVLIECERHYRELHRFALRPYWTGWAAQVRDSQRLTCFVYPDGRKLERVRYGQEDEDWGADRHRCHDCGVARGEIHLASCDAERCPVCGGQSIGCECDYVGEPSTP